MATIRYNPNGKQKGKITYNADIVRGIVMHALQETRGVEPVPSKSRAIKLCFEKEGLFIDISVIAHYGYKVPELAFRIQQTVQQMVESMTKFKIAKIDVHVQSVVFPEPPAPAPAAETDGQEGQDNQDEAQGNQ